MAPTSQVLTDLDALCGLPATIRLAGQEWKVPARPPLDWLFTFQVIEEQLAGDDVDEMQVVEQARDHMVDLIAIHQPDRREEIHQALGRLDALSVLIAGRAIYTAGGPEAAPADPPKAKPRAGTRSTSSRPRKRSRSST